MLVKYKKNKTPIDGLKKVQIIRCEMYKLGTTRYFHNFFHIGILKIGDIYRLVGKLGDLEWRSYDHKTLRTAILGYDDIAYNIDSYV